MSNLEIQDDFEKEVMIPEKTPEYAIQLEQSQDNTKTIRDKSGYGILLIGDVNFVQDDSRSSRESVKLMRKLVVSAASSGLPSHGSRL